MFNPAPKVSSTYGAPMGRRSYTLDVDAGRLHLRHVPLNNGGYDAGGAYWGHGQRLYCAMDQDGSTEYFRGSSRDAVKAKIADCYPGALFLR